MRDRGLVGRVAIVVALGLAATVACDEAPHGLRSGGEATGFSAAYDRWEPGPDDTCRREDHNRYSVVGPDGLLYPTWHPPVDPATGCTFGHEHGRDPGGSALYSEVGDIPFGLALPADHVGYKVEWENDLSFRFSGGAASSLLEVSCDVMVELHQGSHGAGAFVINTHEFALHAHCSDGAHVHVQMITTIGDPGEFESSCDRDRVIQAGTPPDAPDGNGHRFIPDRPCVEEFILVAEGERSNFGSGLRESWEVSDRIRTEDGRTLLSFNPYFQVRNPARYYDPAVQGGLARTVEVCYEELASGERARGGHCGDSATAVVAWDDPGSPFQGARRFVDVNSIRVTNADGPSIWYTDVYGKNARRDPFPGSIRQFIAGIDNTRATQPSGPAIGDDRDYGGDGVHAPN
ncbi:MAG: hypothetical protein GWN99_16615 [Gemmatimonadetes bacterium]|uniref:Uncharacterized protein n=1 Tax=Candidatus Kutchimonas denitrificans TaxID=3056748 RepID=A0AAE4Z826_9BACT|nr:hypothetical protein [Gemmatimonadota bacterium]NIR74412.1 hypothetical protein [Candidatus Kutchimonas denitrificans]NIS02663.1 hypothetical protein [Gemmatimonadota bacterium]NIT68538.1 hypothetical protein [Gemmatimonadota bacterium]NIU52015.1 hypothetical protein [Gemmatimonadota bacterium]